MSEARGLSSGARSVVAFPAPPSNTAFGGPARGLPGLHSARMSVTLREVLLAARRSRTAVFACNVNDMVDVRACAAAAAEVSVPLVLNVSPRAIEFAGLARLAAVLDAERRHAPADLFVQLDHGRDLDLIEACLLHGFDAVMADGSDLPLDANIAFCRRAVSLAEEAGAVVEVQVGRLRDSRNSGGPAEPTAPGIALRLLAETGSDCLSVAIGNEHDYYLDRPASSLDLSLLAELDSALPDTPLVLHGADTVADRTLAEAIQAGITKVNVGPFLRKLYMEALRGAAGGEEHDPRLVAESVSRRLTEALVAKLRGFKGCLYVG